MMIYQVIYELLRPALWFHHLTNLVLPRLERHALDL